MNCQSLIIFAVILFGCFLNVEPTKVKTSEQPKVRSRLKAGYCQADNETIVVQYCYIKAVSKLVVTAHVSLKILIPLDQVFLQFILNYRYGLVYRPVIDTKPQDWCAIMKGANTNPYIKLIIDTIKDTASSAIHECPYADEFHLDNLTLNYDRVDPSAVFPAGNYRLETVVFRDKKEVLRMIVEEEIKSPRRETFG